MSARSGARKYCMKQLSTVSQGWRIARMIRASGKSRRIRGKPQQIERILVHEPLVRAQLNLVAHPLPIARADCLQLFGTA
jgi:hypothetical protein